MKIINKIIQIMYIIVYRLLMCYWFIRRPVVHGVYVAVWTDGKILIIKNSYKKYYTLPCGSVKRKENPAEAAVRELKEEVNISAKPEDLNYFREYIFDFEFKKDHIHIFELEVPFSTSFKVDNREVIWGAFQTIEEALAMKLAPPIRQYLEKDAQNK